MKRQTYTRRRFVSLAGASAAALTFNIGRAHAADKMTVLLDWRVTGQHAPFFVGLAEGIFQKHGIDLTIVPGNGSRNTILAVATNNANFGLADATALPVAVLQGADVKMFFSYMATTPMGIIFLADKGISKPKDLEGKTYGDFPGSATFALFPVYAKKAGIDIAKVKIANVGPTTQASALTEGQIDATFSSLNDSFFKLRHAGVKLGSFSYAKEGLNLLSQGLIASEATLRNRDLVRRFSAAFAESLRVSKADIPKAAATTKRLAPTAPEAVVMVDMITDTLGVRLTNARNANRPSGWMAEEDWRDLVDLLTETGALKERVATNRLYSNDYISV